jgi:hypothetical protein
MVCKCIQQRTWAAGIFGAWSNPGFYQLIPILQGEVQNSMGTDRLFSGRESNRDCDYAAEKKDMHNDRARRVIDISALVN